MRFCVSSRHHAFKPAMQLWTNQIFTAQGPRFIRQDVLGHSICVRRVGNLFYTHDFAEVLFQEMILHNAKAALVSSH